MNTHSNLKAFHSNTNSNYTQLSVSYDYKNQIEWCYLSPSPIPCFNTTLVKELNQHYQLLHENNNVTRTHKINYEIMASTTPGVFNLGGDLEFFRSLIMTKDRTTLAKYAQKCVDTMYAIATLHKKGTTQIALVQGDALGGGFETALAADIIIAEKQAKFGFPDVLFNSFPGIGAYTFLTRKVGMQKTEEILLSGKLYSAEELFDLGIIDVLAENDEGDTEVYKYIKKAERSSNAIKGVQKVRDIHHPIELSQLREVADVWVDTVLQLSKRDIRMMERLISKQNTKSSIAA